MKEILDAYSKVIQQLLHENYRREEMSELKPCPFCGSIEQFVDGNITSSKCRCFSTDMYDDVWVDNWNNRPIEDKLREENERLRKVVDALTLFLQNHPEDLHGTCKSCICYERTCGEFLKDTLELSGYSGQLKELGGEE